MYVVNKNSTCDHERHQPNLVCSHAFQCDCNYILIAYIYRSLEKKMNYLAAPLTFAWLISQV